VRQVGEAACDVCRGGCELATAGVEGGGKLMVCKRPSNRMVDRGQKLSGVTFIVGWPMRLG
jgi:hypothetical protein